MTAKPGVLFDVDGTLVDTTYLHTVAWWEALRQYDHDVPMAEIHRGIGMGADQILDHLLGDERDKDADDDMTTAHDVLYGSWWERLRPLPGGKDLLEAVAGRGLAVVLASSAKENELTILRRIIDADDAVTAATSSSDAERSKPAPDILEAALAQSQVDVDRCVFVGDAVWDVKAAAKLDIPCIGLACGGTSAAELKAAGAIETYRDPADLLGNLENSAIAKLTRD
jgi:HAD superfamily hydrolase (TIGR01509 family)